MSHIEVLTQARSATARKATASLPDLQSMLSTANKAFLNDQHEQERRGLRRGGLGKDDVHRFSLQADDPIVAIAIHQQATVVAYKARCQARPAFAPARAAQLADFEQREAPSSSVMGLQQSSGRPKQND
jgi:hypothetical protein